MKKFCLVGVLCCAVVLVIGVTQDEAELAFNSHGILWVSSENCNDKNNENCTSFEGLNQRALDGIIQFKERTNCPITITGATETGHSNKTHPYDHWGGYKLDIRRNDCLDLCIQNDTCFVNRDNITIKGKSCQRWKDCQTGYKFCNEGDHYDIQFVYWW